MLGWVECVRCSSGWSVLGIQCSSGWSVLSIGVALGRVC